MAWWKRTLFVCSIGWALSASADHGSNSPAQPATPPTRTWEQWDGFREAYSKKKNHDKEAYAKSLLPLFLGDIPRLGEEKSPDWVRGPSGLTPAQKSRVEIRLNLKRLKRHIVSYLEEMLSKNPPIPAADAEAGEVCEIVADWYIRSVDDFLRTHPGARPELGHRNFVANLVGLQNEFNSPWCADWAAGMITALDDLPEAARVHQYFRFGWAQTHSRAAGVFPIQHNYLMVRVAGYPEEFPMDPEKRRAALFDPWRSTLPLVYYPNPDGKWYENPTNTGVE